MQDMGIKTLKDLQAKARSGECVYIYVVNHTHAYILLPVRFELRSSSAQVEGNVHGLVSFEKKLYS